MFESVTTSLGSAHYYRDAWKLQKAGRWEELNRLADELDNPVAIAGTPEKIVTILCLVAAGGAVIFGPALFALAAQEARKEKQRER